MTTQLFNHNPVFRYLQERQSEMEQAIIQASDSELQQGDLEVVVSKFVESYTLTPPSLDEGKIHYGPGRGSAHTSTSWDFGRQTTSAGSWIQASIPFAGSSELFQVQPSSFTSNPPRGEVSGQTLILTFPHQNKSAEAVQRQVNQQLMEIKQYLATLTSDVESYNEGLRRKARQLIEVRRSKVNREQSLFDQLNQR